MTGRKKAELTKLVADNPWRPEEFSQRVYEMMSDQNATLRDLDEIGVCQRSTIPNWEYYGRTPTAFILKKLCIALDVSADYLLGLSNRKKVRK